MDFSKNKALKILAVGALIASAVPARALYRSCIDNCVRKTVKPKIGSILYVDLACGYMEHSGIYIGGDDEACIVELQNDHGTCIIKRVTPEEFISGGTGFSIYVSCHGEDSVGDENFARTAESMIGMNLGDYKLLSNNCHMFTSSCMDISHDLPAVIRISGLTGIFKDILINNFDMSLTALKSKAKKLLGADNWRVWHPQVDSVNSSENESGPKGAGSSRCIRLN
jgi:hypothetical protein